MAELSQPMEALQRGNRIRLKRAALKREVRAGTQSVAAVMAEKPLEARTMSIYDLLCAQHRWGRSRSLAVLAGAGVREGRKVGELTARQASVIAALCEPPA